MEPPNTNFQRHSTRLNWIPLCVLLALAPIVYWGAETVPSSTTDTTSWLPDGAIERERYVDFVSDFGDDSFALVTWPGCSLDNSDLTEFADSLLNDATGRQLIRHIITGHQLVERLTSKPLELPRADAIDRLQGVIVGPDHQTTAAILQLTEQGGWRQHDVVEIIYQQAEKAAGIPRDQIRIGGSVYEAVTFDIECDRSLRAFVLPAMLVTFLTAMVCLRRIDLVLIVVAVGGFSRYMSLAFIHFTGGSLDPIMIVIPVLVLVLTVSGSIHVVNYYLDEERERGPAGAGRRAQKAALVPCGLATVSTAIGLASLEISDLQRIRNFGTYSTLTLLLSLILVLVVVPCTLNLQLLRRFKKQGHTPEQPNRSKGELPAIVARLLAFVVARRRPVIATAMAIIVATGAGLSRTTTTVKLEKNFREESQIIQNYRWIEQHVAPLISIETLVQFGAACELSPVERLDLIAEIQSHLKEVPGIGGVISAATFAPPVEAVDGLGDALRRRVYQRRLTQNRQISIDEGFLAEDENNNETWRITSRVPALNSKDFVALDYSTLIEQVKNRTEQVISRKAADSSHQIAVEQTGIIPMVEFAQEQLLDDLVKSMALAIVLICPIMILNLRSVTAGLLAMIPNVLPIIVIYGMLGWCGIEIDIGSVLTGSIALGIAVDDTLHVLNWYKIGVAQNMPTEQAIQFAYQRCAKAMFQTTLICGLGILVLTLSTFVPTVRFAFLMSLLLWVALVGDMIVLPALLAGPMGTALTGKRDVDSTDMPTPPTGDHSASNGLIDGNADSSLISDNCPASSKPQ